MTKMKTQGYITCTRCNLVVALLTDGRPLPHARPDLVTWCEGAHRPSFDAGPTDAEAHRFRHQELYRALRELVEDHGTQTGERPQTTSLMAFLGWAHKQNLTPDHADMKPHH